MRYSLGDLWLYLDCNVIQENTTTPRYIQELVKYGLQKINQFDEGKLTSQQNNIRRDCEIFHWKDRRVRSY
jgi:hypothetical protein